MRVTRDTVLNGIHIGEHSFVPEKIREEIYDRVIKPGYNFVTIRPGRNLDLDPKYFVEWAEYLAENKVYFVFLYTIQNAPKGKESYLDKETVAEIKKVAGEYFVGDMIGETGSSVAPRSPCLAPNRFLNNPPTTNQSGRFPASFRTSEQKRR